MLVSAVRARTIGVGALLVCTVLGLTAAAPGPAQAAVAACATTPVIAHRGLQTGGVTENTRGAVLAAAQRGAGFEVDLRTTRDGHVVLMHDRSVARTTRGRGMVDEMTLRTLRTLRTDDGQRVPTLRVALLVLRDHPEVRAVLDLKALTDASQERVRDEVRELGVADRVSVIGVRDLLLARSRSVLPEVPAFRILRDLPTVEQAQSHGGVNVRGEVLTPEWVDAMAAADVPFNIRVTDDPVLWERGLSSGTSWVMTDAVEAYQAWCAA